MKINSDYMQIMRRGKWMYKNIYRKEQESGISVFVCLVLIILILLVASLVHAENVDMNKIMMIESSGCVQKYGHFEHARGCYQVTQSALDDWNVDHPREKYNLEDMLNDELCLKVADWYINVKIARYIKHYKLPDTVENRCIAYNWGIGSLVKWYRSGAVIENLPKVTQKYLIKYRTI